MSALTMTIGSPPNGSSTNRIQPANTATQSPSTPAMARVTSGSGTTKRFFVFGFWPSGLLRSSVGSASVDKRRLRSPKGDQRSLTAER